MKRSKKLRTTVRTTFLAWFTDRLRTSRTALKKPLEHNGFRGRTTYGPLCSPVTDQVPPLKGGPSVRGNRSATETMMVLLRIDGRGRHLTRPRRGG
jgi:hypothetical protein